MPLGNLDGNKETSIPPRAGEPRGPSGTLQPEPAHADNHDIHDLRGAHTRVTNGLVEIYSMPGRRFGLSSRLPASAGDHRGREPEAEIGLNLQATHGSGDDLPAVRAFRRRTGAGTGLYELARGNGGLSAPRPRRALCNPSIRNPGVRNPIVRPVRQAAGVHFDFHAEFIVEHSEREPGLRAERGQDVLLRALVIANPFRSEGCVVRQGGGKQIRGPRGIPPRTIHGRIHHAWTRLPRLRKKYNRHEHIPSPLVGHSCGASPSPHITPISGPFPGDIHTWAYVPGPLTGDIGRGPGTCARSPGRTPPNSHEKSALSRCVVGWVESGYVERGAHDTRHLSSCLVTSSTISGQMRGGSGG